MLRWARILVTALVVVIVAVPASTSADDSLPPGGTFVDDDGDVHEGYIEAIAVEGITRGCDPPMNIHYCPDVPVTRGQMAAFMRRAFHVPAAGEGVFTDVGGSEFAQDIAAIAAAGFTKGCNPPDNTGFCPDDLVTRGQMAAFLRRALRLDSAADSPFTDDDDSVFESDIAELATAGVAKGCDPPANTMFCPDDPLTRAQMASFLGRALDLNPTVPQARPAVFQGVPWSIVLPVPTGHPEPTFGWVAADFYDRGLAMMDLRDYDTPDATITEHSVHVLEPVGGRWVPSVLLPASTSVGDPAPLELAADGARVVVTAYPPSVHVFTRTATGWDEAIVSLSTVVTGDEFGAGVAVSNDRIVVGLDSARFAVLDWTGSDWNLTTRSAPTPYGEIAADGPDIVFAAGESTYVMSDDGGSWTTSRLEPVVTGHAFGSSVDIDDGRVLVAANGSTPGPGTSGAVYLYTQKGDAWVGETIATGGDGFGDAARLDDGIILFGGSHSDPGSLWIYEENAGAWSGRRIESGFDDWVDHLAIEGRVGVAIDFRGYRDRNAAVLFGID